MQRPSAELELAPTFQSKLHYGLLLQIWLTIHVFLGPWPAPVPVPKPAPKRPPWLHPNVPPNQPHSMCRSFASSIPIEEASPLSICSLV